MTWAIGNAPRPQKSLKRVHIPNVSPEMPKELFDLFCCFTTLACVNAANILIRFGMGLRVTFARPQKPAFLGPQIINGFVFVC